MTIETTPKTKASELSGKAVEALKTQLRGLLIQPGDESYEAARKVYNGMIDKYPALIVRCADIADVISAVNFGRQYQLTVAVRGGGHNGAGFGTCEGGLVIDLSSLRGIRIHPSGPTVQVSGGCLWGDVDHATHPFGLAVPSGFLSTTGVGGLTLGGGIGYLTRRFGLSIDQLLSADIVLADGRMITASPNEYDDLFWALRGGGGNFGVVTSFEFRGSPVHTVYGGPMFWPLDAASEILPYWQDLILNAPEELNGWFGVLTVPPSDHFPAQYHLQKVCTVVWCYTGPIEKAEELFKPIRSFRQPAMDLCGPIPFPVLQSLFDVFYPAGLQWYWRSTFFDHYSQEAINLHLQYADQLPTPYSTMHIYPINGAAGRVGSQDTAWGYRSANFAQVIVGVDPNPANNESMIQWAKNYSSALHPYSAGGGYVNMIMEEGQERVKAAYGQNYSRLAKIKAKYDPDNLFHVNQNILPE